MVRLFILIGFWLFLNSGLILAQEESKKEDIEIYVGGQRLESLHSYKSIKLKKLLKTALDESGQEIDDIFLASFLESFSKERLYDLTEEEIQAVVNQLMEEEPEISEEINEMTEIIKMQEMLNEYRNEHEESEQIEIDPSKMKTIEILPKKKRRDIFIKNKAPIER